MTNKSIINMYPNQESLSREHETTKAKLKELREKSIGESLRLSYLRMITHIRKGVAICVGKAKGKSVVVGTVANDIDRTAVIKKHATKRKWTCSRYRVNRYVNLRTFPTKKAAIDNGIDWCATGVST